MEIIEHYGKAIIALGAIAAAVTILVFVTKKISSTTTSVTLIIMTQLIKLHLKALLEKLNNEN